MRSSASGAARDESETGTGSGIGVGIGSGNRTTTGPTVLLLDGDHDTAVHVATELHDDLDASVVGVGTSERSRLLRSRFCDRGVTAPHPGSDGYDVAIRDLVRRVVPDVVVPVGHDSVATLLAVRDQLPTEVGLCLPSDRSFSIATDKRLTMNLARELDIPVPEDHTARVREIDRRGRPDDGLVDLEFPVFLKARKETGEAHTAEVEEPARFWTAYDRLKRVSNEDVLVQGHVAGDDHTYACGLLFTGGALQLVMSHEELRSVPRRGGSGTRLRLFQQPRLEALSVQLLRELEWNGVALVEFKRRRDGTYVLMEINPKFWASYALASQCGYRFASTMVARTLDLAVPPSGRPNMTGERVFPLRELLYWWNNREEESLFECLGAMLWPPARPDVNLTDLRSALTPPNSREGDADAD